MTELKNLTRGELYKLRDSLRLIDDLLGYSYPETITVGSLRQLVLSEIEEKFQHGNKTFEV